MNKEIIKESLVYDELGLSPIWVTLPKKVNAESGQLPTNSSIYYLKKIKLNDLNVLFLAPIFNLSDTGELQLFKKISVYLDSLSDKLNQLQLIKRTQDSVL